MCAHHVRHVAATHTGNAGLQGKVSDSGVLSVLLTRHAKAISHLTRSLHPVF